MSPALEEPKIEATDGNQSSIDLKNSEGEFRIISDGGELSIYDQTDTTERFRIDTTGNVGIGTNNPSAPLHIAGDGRVAIFGDSSFDDKYIELREGGTTGLRMGLRTNLVDSSGCILLQTGDDKGLELL